MFLLQFVLLQEQVFSPAVTLKEAIFTLQYFSLIQMRVSLQKNIPWLRCLKMPVTALPALGNGIWVIKRNLCLTTRVLKIFMEFHTLTTWTITITNGMIFNPHHFLFIGIQN